jgi:ABC-type dipeptide/oligopeptide/nickel transport system ATPase component
MNSIIPIPRIAINTPQTALLVLLQHTHQLGGRMIQRTLIHMSIQKIARLLDIVSAPSWKAKMETVA